MKKYLLIAVLTAVIFIVMIMSIFGFISNGIGMIITILLVLAFNVLGMVLARKEHITFVFYLMLVLSIICGVLLVINILCLEKLSQTKSFDFQITAEEAKGEKTKIFTYNNTNFYTYNMKNIGCIKGEKKMSLEDALKSGLTIDEIKSAMIPDKKNKDATIYRDGGVENVANSSYSIAFCDSGKDVGDVVIVPFNYKYEEGICS